MNNEQRKKQEILKKLDDEAFVEKFKKAVKEREQNQENTVEKRVEKDTENKVGMEEQVTWESIREKALAMIPNDADLDIMWKLLRILKSMD